jgi:hypothetical protein
MKRVCDSPDQRAASTSGAATATAAQSAHASASRQRNDFGKNMAATVGESDRGTPGLSARYRLAARKLEPLANRTMGKRRQGPKSSPGVNGNPPRRRRACAQLPCIEGLARLAAPAVAPG